MDNERALEIIGALASGIDPFTGEVFGQESVFQNPEAVRALFAAARALEDVVGGKKRKKRDPNFPAEAGKPWTEEENLRLVVAFDAGQTQKQLAESHKRTVGAIRSRLIKLGKLDVPVGSQHT